MKFYEFSREETNALLDVLYYYLDNLSGDTAKSYEQARRLYKRLAPRVEIKEGWIVVYPDKSVAGVYDTEKRAYRQRGSIVTGQVLRIEWQEEV